MGEFCESDRKKLHAKLHLHKIAGHMTEILEFQAENPSFHVLFIPGNPGIVSFYQGYLERVYELLDRKASITAIGHIAHTSKDWEDGRLFSLKEQINHKVEFIKEELLPQDIPILLAGHSIGAYISLEIFKFLPEKVSYMIGMYPFLTLNRESQWQSLLTKSAKSPIISAGVSSFAGLLGLFPAWFHRGLLKYLLGRSWSSDAVHVACTYLLRLQENPDWIFIREKQNQIAFLFGIDDHWGPLSLFEEISQNAPVVKLTIEKEAHMHAFCCTKAGSAWVANHTADLIKHFQCTK
uniref:Lipid droplet-associated hydrolase n=1 Tax=Araucaria cunninghamii TaxID=56994 RepID=A0A0D6QZ95_ARACU